MPNLLIVDDHSVVRTGLKLIIENFIPLAYIDEADDGDSAFEKIKHNQYDLIILDVTMPNTDSAGLISTILSFKPKSKILMFSMNAEETYAKRYLKMGAMGYIRKDAPGTEIKKAITTVLNNKRYISEEMTERLLGDMHGDSTTQNPFDKLSPREFEILQHLILGEFPAEICQKLKLHPSTVGTHKSRIFEKLQCQNIIELSTLAKVNNIIFN